LELLAPINNPIDMSKQITDSSILRAIKKHKEGVSLTRRVLLRSQEPIDDLRRINQQLLTLRKPIHGHDCADGISSNKWVAMLQIGENRWDQGLDDLGLVQSTKESQGDAANVLVGALEIVAEVLADEDHLRENFASGIGFVNDLEVQQQKLLHGVVFGGENVANYGDEELWNGVAVEQEHDCLLQSFDLCFDVVSF
jgi:hypothetical protein